VQLVINKQVNSVFSCKTIDKTTSMLPHAFLKVTRHSDVKSAVSFAGENIDCRLLSIVSLDSCFRRNDGHRETLASAKH
jgi:hypothetical protein